MPAKTAWVTGGARGIGAASCLRLAEMGYNVAVGCVHHSDDAHAVEQECQERGVDAIVSQADVREPAAVEGAHRDIVERLGHVSVLVASHGIYTRTPLERLDPTVWRETMEVNLTGAFLVTRAVLPAMREGQWGRLVYLGSILGRTGSPHGAHYAASKGGLLAFARSVAEDVARDGITANLVAPSMIDTDILAGDTPAKRAERERQVPVGRIGAADECAAAVAYLVSDDAGYVTGTELRVDGGFKMG